MSEAAEAIVRTRHKQQTRWMGEGWAVTVQKRCGASAKAAASAAVAFLLSFADLCGIPSGFHAAWLAAVVAEGGSLRWPMAGCLAAFPMRLIWGIDPQWPMLISAALIFSARKAAVYRSNAALMLLTALSLLPQALVSLAAGTQRETLYAFSAAAIGALAAPVMYRARSVLRSGRDVNAADEYLAVGYVAALLLCGGGRIYLPFVQLGAFGAALITLTAAVEIGVGAGCMAGMIGGAVLAMQGVPMQLSMALALAGFLTGTVSLYGRRGWALVSFPAAGVLALYLSGTMQVGLPGAVVLAAVVIWRMPAVWMDRVRSTLRRFSGVSSAQDGYAAALLTQWEKSMDELMAAVPKPEQPASSHDAGWWRLHLCDGCPDAATCTCMTDEAEAARADEVLASLLRGEGETAMDGLRWLGCGRLYYMREGMYAAAQEHTRHAREAGRAAYDRDLLLTHMQAATGAARRFAALTEPGWWDGMYAARLRRAAAELALPCRLLYARRADGHICVAWQVEGEEDMAEELRALTSSVVQLPMICAGQDDRTVRLCEMPVYEADAAVASVGKVDNDTGNGDAALLLPMENGMYMVALSDGMGHGCHAHRESVQTTDMLARCLSGGYTRNQALTVVNGMMLAATHGERFATVDLVLADLWSGDVTLDKLGAANSYLLQDDGLSCLTGNALPLGILETVDSRSCTCRMKEGDALVLMTDGVEDAFYSPDALETAVRASLKEETVPKAAAMLLEAACAASGGETRDDRTVVVLRLKRTAVPADVRYTPDRYTRKPRRSPFSLQRLRKGV